MKKKTRRRGANGAGRHSFKSWFLLFGNKQIHTRHHVFPSFHCPDVRKGFLSHLLNLFERKGITTFKDQEITRGYTIGPELVQAIRESRLSIVVLSKKYASSSWCLDELVEILKCKKDHGRMVMAIFYQVDPSDVRKQRGEFGSAFQKTCEGKGEGEKNIWIKALADVATIAGEHSSNWDEAKMIEKIAADVLNKLNVTPSNDFEGMVGMEAHLRKINSYLGMSCDDVKMIGIQGPAGIGLYSSSSPLLFGNLKGSYGSSGVHDSKLCLQSQLLSKILNQKDMSIDHPGAIKEWLQHQKVLIVLDDVDDLEQLDALAEKTYWFGLGSQIIVTTKDRKILKVHGIKNIYHVGYPSEEEALEILCLSAFKQSYVQVGFEKVTKKVAKLCGYLPLGLCVVGSSLRGESTQEKLEDVLKVGYDKLLDKYQSLFLHIALFFNDRAVDHVTTTFADSNLDVSNGLNTLADKSLVQIVYKQSEEPGNPLPNLKNMNLGYSKNLKEIPNLSKAINLETLTLMYCISLVELPFSVWNLHKLRKLRMRDCRKLQLVPIKINLETFERVERNSLSRFKNVPRFSMNIKYLNVGNTLWKKFIHQLSNWLCLGGQNVKRITGVQESVKHLHLSNSDIDMIPDCVVSLPQLESLFLNKCRQLMSLQGLPPSLKYIDASNCRSLERVCFSFNHIITHFMFQNCFNLDEESRRVIIQQRGYNNVWLPATGNFIIIPTVLDGDGTFSAYSGFKACLVLPPTKNYALLDINCCIRTKSGVIITEIK
ncbi:hypothetical protein N665_0123s0043 [Sinapis alba]|nr:hypothetical protein N665_0123s0043 [Sinapis alba]